MNVILQGSLSGVAYNLIVALTSSNLYSSKKNKKVKEDTINKQENLMNSNKQRSPTIKNTLIPEEPGQHTKTHHYQ